MDGLRVLMPIDAIRDDWYWSLFWSFRFWDVTVLENFVRCDACQTLWKQSNSASLLTTLYDSLSLLRLFLRSMSNWFLATWVLTNRNFWALAKVSLLSRVYPLPPFFLSSSSIEGFWFPYRPGSDACMSIVDCISEHRNGTRNFSDGVRMRRQGVKFLLATNL